MVRPSPHGVSRADDQKKSEKANDVQKSQGRDGATDEWLEGVGEEVQAGRSRDFRVPDVPVREAVVLCLADVEDFVLGGM